MLFYQTILPDNQSNMQQINKKNFIFNCLMHFSCLDKQLDVSSHSRCSHIIKSNLFSNGEENILRGEIFSSGKFDMIFL